MFDSSSELDPLEVYDDLVMAGPQFAIDGAGTINLPQQTVSYRINPKVASGKNDKLKDFAVPVRIDGPLAKPKIYPEVQGVLENPQGALDQLDDISGGLLSGVTGDKKPGKAAGGDKNNKKKSKNKKDKKKPVADQVLDLLQSQ